MLKLKYFYLILTIICTSSSQVILKFKFGELLKLVAKDFRFCLVTKLLVSNLWFWLCGFCCVGAICFWILTLTKFELSIAFPIYFSFTLVVVIFISFLFFGEPINFLKFFGLFFMLIGSIFVGLSYR